MADSPNGNRPAFIELIERYKTASKMTWKQVNAAANVDASTRDQWFSGRTRNHPLVGIVRLCAVLDVPPDELFSAVMQDEIYEESLTRRADLETRLRALEDELKLRPTRDEVRQLVEGDFAREVRADAVRFLAERAAALGHEAQDRPAGEGGSGTQQ